MVETQVANCFFVCMLGAKISVPLLLGCTLNFYLEQFKMFAFHYLEDVSNV